MEKRLREGEELSKSWREPGGFEKYTKVCPDTAGNAQLGCSKKKIFLATDDAGMECSMASGLICTNSFHPLHYAYAGLLPAIFSPHGFRSTYMHSVVSCPWV